MPPASGQEAQTKLGKLSDDRIATLFDAVAHGDDEHRAWLKEAIEAHFAGRPLPEVRGCSAKDVRITELKEIATTAMRSHEQALSQLEEAEAERETIRENLHVVRAANSENLSRIAELEAANAKQRGELRGAKLGNSAMDTAIAVAADHMNTWAREWQVEEVARPWSEFGLRELAERLWIKSMAREDALRSQLAALQAECERLKAENHEVLDQPAGEQTAAPEKPARPPMLLAKVPSLDEWQWWIRRVYGGWFCIKAAWVSECLTEVDRERSDPDAVGLYDADLASSSGATQP